MNTFTDGAGVLAIMVIVLLMIGAWFLFKILVDRSETMQTTEYEYPGYDGRHEGKSDLELQVVSKEIEVGIMRARDENAKRKPLV